MVSGEKPMIIYLLFSVYTVMFFSDCLLTFLFVCAGQYFDYNILRHEFLHINLV